MDFQSMLAASSALGDCLRGLGMAVVFHWLTPQAVDTVAAGAWFVGLGWIASLLIMGRDR